MGRRVGSISGVVVAAIGLLVLLPVWLPLTALVDLVRLQRRLPLTRLVAFALCWAWLELIGVLVAAGLWLIGQRRNRAVHYRLQRWWAGSLMRALEITTGVDVAIRGLDAFTPGPVVVLCRHASLADSLVSAHVITGHARMHPRYVLKRELLADPCLDIVGHRVPNHFLVRDAADSTPELAALVTLSTGMGERDVAVIFPEGTRSNDAKRRRALERIAARDPDRAERLAPLTALLPPRPAGALALLRGAPDADVVLAWHTGFDGLDTFGGILRHLAGPDRSVLFVARRVPRAELPDTTPLTADADAAFTAWLDTTWLTLDTEVRAALNSRDMTRDGART
jgi:1-acyl-sn-glycerol-3-phosphate acyltransferase